MKYALGQFQVAADSVRVVSLDQRADSAALDSYDVVDQSNQFPAGDDGPVPVPTNGTLECGPVPVPWRAAPDADSRKSHALENTEVLLFLQGDVEIVGPLRRRTCRAGSRGSKSTDGKRPRRPGLALAIHVSLSGAG